MTCWTVSTPGAMARLAGELGGWYALEESRPVTRKYVCLDDFNRHIFHAGGALYRSGRHWELCVGTACHALHATRRPVFAADLEPSPFRAALQELVGIRKLEPVAEVRCIARSLTCRDELGKIVLRIAARELASAHVLELRTLRGYQDHAGRVRGLLRSLGARRVPGGLPHVLLRASGFEPGDYRSKPVVRLAPDMPAAEAVTALAVANLAVARSNEAGMLRAMDDTEFLHDYRVALRRVRSLLSLLREVYPERFDQAVRLRLGALARKTNRLRDLDVYLLDRPHYQELLSAEFRPGLEVMFADFARRQRAERRSVRRWLASAAYQREIAGVVAAFADRDALGHTRAGRCRLVELVTPKLARRYRKVCKLGRRVDETTPDEELHRLRIECKKLRYMLEFFGELYDREAVAELVNRLRLLQNNLGRFNDCAVQQATLRDYLRTAPEDKHLAMAIGALLLALEQEKQAERAQLAAHIDEFAGKRQRKRARKLFAQATPADGAGSGERA